MPWSYSALKDFENCARRYHEVRILKRYKERETEQKLYGDELHKAAEAYAKTKQALPEKFAFMQPLIDTLLAKEGKVYPEHQMALTIEYEPCDWWDKRVWVRGKADLLIIDDAQHMAWMVDYKTGKNKDPDKDQLDLLTLLIFEHFPNIVQVNSALAFVVNEAFVKHKRFLTEREDLWWRYLERIAKLEKANEAGVWNPQPSGLCKKHCAVLSCEYNGRGE